MQTGDVDHDSPALDHSDEEAGVLFVDLDGTLVRTDLLQEAVVHAVTRNLASVVSFLQTLPQGIAAAKRALAQQVTIDASHLPWNQEVMDFVAKQRASRRKVVLATATDAGWAGLVADATNLFDDVLASDGKNNLKGEAKLRAIKDYCRQHGHSAFDYIGDAAADIPIWKVARRAYVVQPTRQFLKRVDSVSNITHVFRRPSSRLRYAFQALRLRQWLKNLLVFVPLILSHEFLNVDKLAAAVTAFVAFGFCASAGYIVNDLLDIQADRLHPQKRNRPFAAGYLSVAWGVLLALGCLVCGLALVIRLPIQFSVILMGYLVLSGLYSGWLKRIVIVDVLVLSSLYTIRLIGGGVATETAVSEWLLGFSLFLFLSLAFAKRYSELVRLTAEKADAAPGRGYRAVDCEMIESIGPTNGYLAVLVFALYIRSEEMTRLYSNGWALWLISPLLIYWISRIWFKAKRRELSEDPVLFALRDRASWIVAALIVLLVFLAQPL